MNREKKLKQFKMRYKKLYKEYDKARNEQSYITSRILKITDKISDIEYKIIKLECQNEN